jgi:hypothetical protein
MIEVQGDLWEYPADVRAITTNGTVRNGKAVMGIGCALEAKQRFPGIERILGGLLRTHGNRCFRIVQGAPSTTLLTFPVKHDVNTKADRQLIADSCMQAYEMADKFCWKTVLIPRPGSGAGGLDYDSEVREIVSMLLDDRFKVITFPS